MKTTDFPVSEGVYNDLWFNRRGLFDLWPILSVMVVVNALYFSGQFTGQHKGSELYLTLIYI